MDTNPTFRRSGPALWACGALLAVLAGACGGSDNVAEERARRAREGEGDLLIAAAWSWSVRSEGLYGEGLDLAVQQINARGGVLGRPLRVVREDDHESVNEGRAIAQRLANNPEVVAVIGHLGSHISIPAAPIYESAGLLMLTPASTSPELTQQGFTRIFRSVNNDVRVGEQLAEYARSRGYRRVMICYVRNEYGLGLANAFEQAAAQDDEGIQVIARQSYEQSAPDQPSSFQRILDEWKDMPFDAIFLAGAPPQAGYFITQARKAGIAAPIFGGDALDTPQLLSTTGPEVEGTVVASVFHPDNPRPEVQRFVAAFEQAYGKRPDSWAARGYEAVTLLAHAIEQAGSAESDAVAEALRTMKDWNGLTGAFTFDSHGDVVGQSMVKVLVREGRFVFLDEAALAHEATATPVQPVSAP
jgi:branched-chain amino acid transport system substrate-binding protein